ncbi:hypothetical protein WJX74_008262 [Apatococcus lobatus]|uniref:GPN-loop GTPase 3 n=1 Tax=Apatococcus lobatus TaxID=904363 RepID=A0AAW1RYI2_9CHLO
MGKFAQLVVGPAGCGKSTYCDHLRQHCEAVGRTVHTVNLDPAAEDFAYPVSFDVRDLISLQDAMDELKLGPNGGLLYCMEYLEDNLDDWLGEELESYGEDDYLVFDCPGQIELYSHSTVFRSFSKYLKNAGWAMCAVYCLDVNFVTDIPKFIAGVLQATAAMVQLELPHVNVLTKVDLMDDKKQIEPYIYPETKPMVAELSQSTGPAFQRLNMLMADLLDEYSMVSFLPLDITDEDSIQELLIHIDHALQYGEDLEVNTRKMDQEMEAHDE